MQGTVKEVELKKSSSDKNYLAIRLNDDRIYRFWNEEDYSKEISPDDLIQFNNKVNKNFNNGSKLVILNQSSNSAAVSSNQEDLIIVLNKINESLIKLSLQFEPISKFFKKLTEGIK